MRILLLSVPFDSGHRELRMGKGPEVLRQSLMANRSLLQHEVRSSVVEIENHFPTEVTATFQVCRQISKHVREAKKNQEFPIVLAGNCSSAVGTLAGTSEENPGIVWFDCHGDFNTPETTVGGFVDGMALSMATGHCWRQLTSSVPGFTPVAEDSVILIGSRDFDDLELKNLSASGIRLVTPSMIRENQSGVEENFVDMQSIYLHIDLDVIDSSFAKANSYSREGGLSPDELIRILARVKEKYRITALGLTAYDPEADRERKIPAIVNAIVELLIG